VRFLFDESSDAPVAAALREDGHAVYCVWESLTGIDDDAVLSMANKRRAILVTADKDFGELVFRLGRAAVGVVLLRLHGREMGEKVAIVTTAVRDFGERMTGAFTVVTPTLIRIRPRR
jgi:predicted nuclease of predicted toxin-antitoxin system